MAEEDLLREMKAAARAAVQDAQAAIVSAVRPDAYGLTINREMQQFAQKRAEGASEAAQLVEAAADVEGALDACITAATLFTATNPGFLGVVMVVQAVRQTWRDAQRRQQPG